MKLLLWLALAVALFWLLRPKRPQAPAPGARDAASGAAARSEPMLQCRHCGIYLPASDAVSDAAGEAYCCDAHRAARTQA